MGEGEVSLRAGERSVVIVVMKVLPKRCYEIRLYVGRGYQVISRFTISLPVFFYSTFVLWDAELQRMWCVSSF